MRKLDSKETWGAERLEADLEAARDGLRDLDRDIRKILGRDLPDSENGQLQTNQRVGQKYSQQEDRKRSSDYINNDQPNNKRRWQSQVNEPKTVFSRLSAKVPSNPDDSGDEDDSCVRPAVSSRVIAPPRDVPSRQDVIRRENVDEKSRQRNKRMFGALLGTLQKFRQEETKLKAKEDKKAEVEARVEEAKRKEKEELKKERQQLFMSRKKQLAEVKALETKLARSKQFQEWRASQLPLAHFVRTRAQPSIYYLPVKSHPRTDALLEKCAKELHDEIEQREKVLLEELEVLESEIGNNKKLQDNEEPSEDNLVDENLQVMKEDEEENHDPNPDIKNNDCLENIVDIKTESINNIQIKQDIDIDNNEEKYQIEENKNNG